MKKVDLAIIGGGAGGLSLAAGAAQLGAKVVLVENHKMGGDCLNYGCVPSKALLAQAKHHHQTQHPLDFAKVMQHVHDTIAHIAVHDSVERFTKLGVDVIQATGQFVGPRTLQAGEETIQAKRFVIATGSSPSIPPIEGLPDIPFYTNETIFALTKLPKKLIVIGGGPIGCELAQAFAMLGSEVTLLARSHILPKEDDDCVAILREQFQRLPITLAENTAIQGCVKKRTNIDITYQQDGKDHTVTGTHVLIATGRSPNVDTLNLPAAEVRFSQCGIEVNDRLQTSNKHIFAIGDVIGQQQFTHMANYHAGILVRNLLFRQRAKIDQSAVPWVTYTDPEIAHVGATTNTGMVTEWPFAENDRARTDQMTTGKIKVATDKKGRILGVTIIGAHAGELLLPWIMTIREGKTLRSFTDTIVPYPTLSEISKRAAGAFYTPKLFAPGTKRLVRWLLKLP